MALFDIPKRLVIRGWNSPTLNTWLGYLVQTLSLVIVLPLVLHQFSVEEIAVWYLFSSVISLQMIADFGFSNTFVRVIAFSMGGATQIHDLRNYKNNNPGEPNWVLLKQIIGTMNVLYLLISFVSFLIIIVAGSFALMKSINLLENPSEGWVSWVIIAIVSSITLYGRVYSNYLLGINKVALTNRWIAITSLGRIATSFFVLILNGGILALVIANQSWNVIRLFVNMVLSHNVLNKKYKTLQSFLFKKSIFKSIWPSAWRGGVSGLMSHGLSQLTGVLYAQFGEVGNVASYLLGLRLITTIKGVALAPFYSKIPEISRLRAENNNKKLYAIAKRGMLLSYITFVLGFIFIGFTGKFLLSLINSNAEFPSQLLWSLFGIAFFLHRFGGMHMQLYVSTNHVISHIADTISGFIFFISAYFLIDYIGLYAFPTGMIIGYLGFYCWYSAMYSYKLIKESFFSFELNTSFIPFLILISYSIINIFFKF